MCFIFYCQNFYSSGDVSEVAPNFGNRTDRQTNTKTFTLDMKTADQHLTKMKVLPCFPPSCILTDLLLSIQLSPGYQDKEDGGGRGQAGQTHTETQIRRHTETLDTH